MPKEFKGGGQQNLIIKGVIQSMGWQKPRPSDVEGWDNLQLKGSLGVP
jgi:hypothetical protein